MKMDVVIGNPPYQDNNGGGNGAGAVSLYIDFILALINNCDYLIYIIPARWMSDRPNGISRETLEQIRCSEHIARLIDYEDRQVFSGVDIAGGVCIALLDNTRTYERRDTFGVIIRNDIYKAIAQKVVQAAGFDSILNP